MREHCGIHAYQDMMSQGRTVDNGTMPNGTLIANSKRGVGIQMERAIILDIRAATYDDGSGITTHDGIVPDAGGFVDGDVADNHCAGADEDIIGDGEPYA